jgi:hypothetical protein
VCGAPAIAQYWVPTTAPETNWWAMACSSNGSIVVAAGGQPNGPAPIGGPIFLSTNSGQTWSPTAAPFTNWGSLACSADGTKIAAAAGWYTYLSFFHSHPGPIYVSGDSGTTWTQTAAPIGDWVTIVSSADGTHLAAGAMSPSSGACIWTSTNSGVSWTPSAAPLTRNQCTWLALSADGTRLFAAEASSYIYTSQDFGATWNSSSPSPATWYTLTCSAGGSRLAAGPVWSPGVPGNYSPIYTSTDFGSTWVPSGSPAKVASWMTSSADGNLLLVVYGGHLYISNQGGSWTDTFNPLVLWGAVACSADGSKLFAAANNNGTIYTYQSAPRLDITLSGASVALSWPAYSTGLGPGQSSDPTTNFVVQYSAGAGGQIWSNLTATPTVVNLTDTLLLTPASGSAVYRLKKAQ